MKSIFDEEIPNISPASIKTHGHFKEWKKNNLYHKAQFKEISCQRCKYFSWGRFNKCKLMGISQSTASDIRASYLCMKFEGK